jgi:hypothetical protein
MKRFVDYFNVNTRSISLLIHNRYKETNVLIGFIGACVFLAILYIVAEWIRDDIIGGHVEHYSSDFPFLTQPHIDNGDKIYIKTLDGKYLSSCVCKTNDANIKNACTRTLCIKDEPLLSSQFTFYKHSDGTFSIETYDGKYWKRCAECINSCPHTICADGINPNLQTHKFVLIKNGKTQTNDPTAVDNTISIKTDNGRLLEGHLRRRCTCTCCRLASRSPLTSTI